jgi:hypothetical protein
MDFLPALLHPLPLRWAPWWTSSHFGTPAAFGRYRLGARTASNGGFASGAVRRVKLPKSMERAR